MKLLVYISLFFSLTINGQDLAEFNDYIQDNITAYRIKYFIDDTFFCTSDFNNTIRNEYLLNSDEEYDLTYVKNYDFKYPKKNVLLFTIYNNYYAKKLNGNNSFKTEVSFGHGMAYSDAISNKLLVGIDTLENRILYIGGNFFKNCISSDFELNINEPISFYSFLKLKLYNYDINKILFKKRRRKNMYFEAYSNSLKSTIYIKVNERDYDDLKVKDTLIKWTERGAYRW